MTKHVVSTRVREHASAYGLTGASEDVVNCGAGESLFCSDLNFSPCSCPSSSRLRHPVRELFARLMMMLVLSVSKMTTFAKSINRRGRLSVYTQTRPPPQQYGTLYGHYEVPIRLPSKAQRSPNCVQIAREVSPFKNLYTLDMRCTEAPRQIYVAIKRHPHRNIPSRSSQ